MNSIMLTKRGVTKDTTVRRALLRPALVLVHRYAGLFMALFLLIAALTGTTIAFQDELDHWLNPALFQVAERDATELDADTLAQRVQQQYPQAFITQLYRDRRPGESVRVRLAQRIDTATGKTLPLPHTEIFVDPFDGHVLGGRERGVFHPDRAHLMPFLDKLHYTLSVPGYWGEWFMGMVALVWTVDCFIGLYLTLPSTRRSSEPQKSWWRRWQPAWLIKRGASFTRFNFDLHRATGLWLWLILLLLATSSVYFNLTNEIFRPVLSWFGPLTPPVTDTLAATPQATRPISLSLEQAVARARTGLSPMSRDMIVSYVGIYADTPGFYKVRFTDADRGYRSWRFHIEEIYVNGSTGEIAARGGHHVGTTADKVIFWQYPLHSGKVFGFWGRAFMASIGLLVAALSSTGVILWLKKRRSEMIRATYTNHA